LADFFRLDPDLLAVAARNSPRVKSEAANRQQLAFWVASLPVREKDEILVRLMIGEEAKFGMELRARFHRQRDPNDAAAVVKDREGHQADFKNRLAAFRNQHAAKKSLLDRMAKGGL
jgi:hypothetical protein